MNNHIRLDDSATALQCYGATSHLAVFLCTSVDALGRIAESMSQNAVVYLGEVPVIRGIRMYTNDDTDS
jgi:hypothetical protein